MGAEGKRRSGAIQGEIVRWHHRKLNGYNFNKLRDGGGQRSLAPQSMGLQRIGGDLVMTQNDSSCLSLCFALWHQNTALIFL